GPGGHQVCGAGVLVLTGTEISSGLRSPGQPARPSHTGPPPGSARGFVARHRRRGVAVRAHPDQTTQAAEPAPLKLSVVGGRCYGEGMASLVFPRTTFQGEQRMRKSEGNEFWVVYQMPAHGKLAGRNVVCEQAEWEALERSQPGQHTLIRKGIPNE